MESCASRHGARGDRFRCKSRMSQGSGRVCLVPVANPLALRYIYATSPSWTYWFTAGNEVRSRSANAILYNVGQEGCKNEADDETEDRDVSLVKGWAKDESP